MRRFLGFIGDWCKVAAVFSVGLFIFVVIPFGLAWLMSWAVWIAPLR